MILTVVDHASNHVPEGVDLGIDPALMTTHIAWDIGAAALAVELGYPAHLATVSRLVIDCNRDEDAPGLIPAESDGVPIPGNHFPTQTSSPPRRRGSISGPDRAQDGEQMDSRLRGNDEREDRLKFYRAYHQALASRIGSERPAMLLSLHSFTPSLKTGEPRPWEVGILYNEDDRAARIAIPLLDAAGVIAGDQQPYSGKILNATMNRHGEETGTPYLGLEVRQDLIDSRAGVAKWAAILRPVIDGCARAVQADRR
ncbi:N-formylglutamate amidohydrolase [Sphingomonas antarctica]|uniref:N-formylglutamate amidohydrolase n=1 Tax=Sphingomonas antarctica TaxID=2040274 RepID=UPI0039E905D5